MQDIQVLCPMNRGGAGARSLNIELQAALNPAGERKVERFGWTFAPGDKVMQIENDYDKEVYNGDIGLVADVDPDAGELTARFEGRDLLYGFGELDTLLPAYAATVHKSGRWIIVATQVGPQASDQGQLVGMLDKINETFGVEPAVVLADAGYCNEPDPLELEDRGIDAHVALGREGKSQVAVDPARLLSARADDGVDIKEYALGMGLDMEQQEMQNWR